MVKRPFMAIDESEVRRIAALSRVRIADEECAALARDLDRVVEHIDRLADVHLPDDAESLTYFDADVHRKDRAMAGLDRADALRNAPDTDDTYFLVPKIVERDEG